MKEKPNIIKDSIEETVKKGALIAGAVAASAIGTVGEAAGLTAQDLKPKTHHQIKNEGTPDILHNGIIKASDLDRVMPNKQQPADTLSRDYFDKAAKKNVQKHFSPGNAKHRPKVIQPPDTLPKKWFEDAQKQQKSLKSSPRNLKPKGRNTHKKSH